RSVRADRPARGAADRPDPGPGAHPGMPDAAQPRRGGPGPADARGLGSRGRRSLRPAHPHVRPASGARQTLRRTPAAYGARHRLPVRDRPVKRGLPLRRRVALAYGLVGVALSLAFGVSTVFIVSDYEVLMLEALLEGHSRDYLEQLAQDPDVELPRTPGFSVYREAEAPPGLRGLPEGR